MGDKTSIIFSAEDRTKAATDSVRAQVLGLQRDLTSVTSSARSFGEVFRTVLVGSAAAAFFKDIVGRTIESERALNQLTATLRATGFAAGQTTQDIRNLVGELSNRTAFDDDDIQKAANALLRFREVSGDTFKDVLRLVPDVATALGTDLVSAAQLLGRSFEAGESSFKGLRAAGVSLTQSQKDLVAQFELAGNFAAAHAVKLEVLQRGVGGAAAGENSGLYGSTRATAKAYDDFLKTLGRSSLVTAITTTALNSARDAVLLLDDVVKTSHKDLKAFLDDLAGIGPDPRQKLGAGGGRGVTTPEQVRADEGARLAFQEEQAEAIRARQALADKNLRLLTKVRTDAELQAQRTLSDQRLQILDVEHERGLVAEKDYYAARLAISQASAQAELRAIDASIREQQQLLSRAKPEEKGGIQADVERLQTQRRQIESRSAFEALKNSQAEIDAQRRLADAIGEVNAQLAEQQHQQAQAAVIRFEQANQTLRSQIQSNFGPDSGLEKRLDQLKQLTVANAQLKEVEEQAGLTRDRLATEEERIQNARRVGAIGELTALKRTDEARQASLSKLREIADQEEAIARTTKDPAQIQAVERFRAEIDALAASADLLGDKFRTTFQDGLSGPLADFITGTRNASDAFNDFIRNIERSLANLAAQNVAEQIFGRGGSGSAAPNFFAKLFGGTSSSGGSGTGFADFLAKLFGSSSNANVYGNLASSGGTLFARGGIAYKPSIFGDGPTAEAAVPLPDGRSIPVSLQGGGGPNVTVHMNFTGPTDTRGFKQSEHQIIASLGNRIKRELARQ